ncbi:hypothetical protein [Paenibacillus sp. yr247]|uniref:hypothetical protein n=1 Tax=Paenibacillus sp. yr247 TaxID=1761880 RepID=UPI00158778D2|nr:hypothetical protein [Paenibacillus sp. yr247]
MGTFTLSQVVVTRSNEEELLSIARTLEEYSTHPTAKAVVAYFKDKGISTLLSDKFRNIVSKV